MSRLLGSVRRPWMVALFAVLAVAISFVISSAAQAAAPVNSAFPTINSFTGYGPTNNRTATVTAGTWTADETPTITYQWYRCYATGPATTTLPADCYVINNRTNADYGINQTDVGWYLRVAETATASGGSVTVYSATTNRVLASRILSSWYGNYCVIKNGGVWCWGSNTNGQLGDNSTTVRNSPVAVLKSDLTPLTGAVAVATSNTHTCAVTDDKSLWCWGANAAGQLGDGTTTASKTAVKVKASLGVDLTDIVDVAVAGDASNSGTSGFTCAINSSGALFCWGLNSSSQLGNGNTTSASYPTALTDMASGVNQVAVSDKSTCAIKNGAAFCWGLNGSGQLGIGNTTNKATPTAVTTLTSNTTGITMGALSACAIRAGAAYCWGDNVTGNLGTGNTTLSNVPVAVISTTDSVPVSLSSGVIDIASNENGSNAPYNSTCFLKESGAVICTGYNQFRQLTNNSNAQSNTPVRSVYYTSNVSEIDMGQYSFCAIMSGAARCLGQTPSGGDGTSTSPTTPSNVNGMTGLEPESYRANISSSTFANPTYVGTGHSIVSVTPNEFSGYPSPSISYSWLACDDNAGGSSATTPSGCSPIANANLSSFTLTSAQFGKYIRLQSQATNTLGARSFVSASTIASGTPPSASGSSTYSGSQAAGVLPGLALSSATTTSFTGTPMPVGAIAWVRCATEVTSTTYSGIDGTLPNGCSVISGATSATYKISQADIGFYVSPAQIATTSSGQSVAFGPSTAMVRGGQRVAMSMTHTCAIKSGLVYCWGSNTNGQLGSGNTTSTTKPSQVPVRFANGALLKDAIAVAVTTAHSCALTNDGSVYCWGINSKGQLGNGNTTQQNFPVQVLASAGTPFTGATALATGGDNTCVIKSAQLYCFGANVQGQIGKGVAEASTNYTYPVLNTALSNGVQQVTMAASNTTCAIKLAQAYCWGSNSYMLLGFSSASVVSTPTLLTVNGTAFSNVSTITLGGYAGCLVSSSVLHCWGGATTGANGFGGNMTLPTRIPSVPSNITQIVSSPNSASASTCFTTISESVYCAGGNDYGNYLYNNASSGLTSFRLTTTISGISEIANGDRATCFVANQSLKCVGFNGSGQVGVANLQPTYYPGTPVGMDKYVGYEDLAPVLNVSTSGFTTPGATLLGKTEAADGTQTFGFPYPTINSSWNTCTEIGVAATALPSNCSANQSAVGDTLPLTDGDLGSKFRYSVTASNNFGTVTSTTAALGPVQSAPTALTSNPTIGAMATPVPLVGHPVSATPSEVSAQGIVTHVYQWYRCSAADPATSASLPAECTLIPEGSARSYQVRPEDTGSYLRFSDTLKSPAGELVMWSPTTSSYAIDGQSIASNGSVTCVISQGMVQCWGATGNLQGDGIGLANLAPKNYVSISAGVRLTDVASVSVGTDSACAVTINGALYCWGLNTNGVLGDGTLVAKSWATPVSATAGGVTFSSGVMQVSVGHVSVCAVKFGGAVYCWGLNTNNVLGNSALTVNTKYSIPQETTRAAALGLTNSGVTRVSVSTSHVCIIQGGYLYCAGYGGYGQLMNGTNVNNTSFDKFVSSNTFWANGGFTDVATSGNTTCFIQSGAVRCVGQANLNQIGTTITVSSGNGMLVFNDELWSGAVSVSGFRDLTGNGGFCANKLDANYCWGVNSSAQAWGLTTTPLTTPTRLPVFVKQLSLGQGNSCGLIGETLTCVGLNTSGALGNGTTNSTATPISTGITSGVGTYYADPATVTQTFTGTLASGSVLTAAQNPFTGYPRPSMSYQWYRCLKAGNSVNVLPTDCFAISGATSETYTVTANDVGKRIRLGATGVVGATTLRNFSAASFSVGVVPVSTNSSLKLIGTTLGTQVGTTFQQSKAVFTGSPAPTVSYKWLRCTAAGTGTLTSVPVTCAEIPGATSISYTTTNGDMNYMIRGQQIATNEIGSTTLVTATTGVINDADRIAVADGTTCVIKDGGVWCVGAGTRGQLGNGASLDSSVPVQVKRTVSTYLTNVRHITGAGSHFCAITWNAQAVLCWGSNTYGELGLTTGTDYNYATQVTGVALTTTVGSLSLGPTSACATTTAGLICWGNKVNGLLGNGQSTGSQSTSVAPAGFTTDANRVSVGASSACVIKLGALSCWGLNTYGQLGDGTTTTQLTPVAISRASAGVSDVAVGSSSTCAVISGAAKCWGNNTFGQLGNGNNTINSAPTTISAATDGTTFDSGVTDISISSNSSSPTQDSVCVTKTTGAVYCFGYNGDGQLLNGETSSTNIPKPALVATTGVTNVAVGSDHSCFIKNNSAYCSGSNSLGQLLDSTTTASSTPVNVASFSSLGIYGSVSATPSTAPSIWGTTVKVGKPVQSDPGVVNAAPPPTYTYLWYVCTAASATATTTATVPTGCTAATGSTVNTDTYTPVAADKDKYLRLYVGLVQGGTTYHSFTATSSKVLPGEPEITFNALPAPIIVGGDAVQLTPVSSTGNTVFTYSSSTPTLCSVTSTGMISGLSSGICDIAVTQAAAGAYDAITVTFSAVTGPGEQVITFAQPDPTPMRPSAYTPTVSVNSGLAVTLTSSTPAVCTASGTSVTLISLGTCTINADQPGTSAYYAAPTVTRSFEITQGAQTLSLSASNIALTDGTYSLPASSSAGLTPTYATTSSSCSISGATLNLLTVGTCVVTASQSGDTNYSAASDVTATFRIIGAPENDSAPTISGAPIFGVSYPSTAGVWVGAGTVTVNQQWYACNSAGDSVVSSGNLGANEPSGCTAISGATSSAFTPTADQVGKRLRLAELASNETSGTTNYTSAFTATSDVVVKQSQTITFASLTSKTYGDGSFVLTATSDRSLTVSYTSSNSNVCTISGSTLTIVGAGSCDVTASQSGNDGTLAAADVVRTLTVAKADQTITLPNFTAGVYGGADKASGATTTSNLPITLASANTSICTVSGLTVSLVAPGTCSITASQSGNANYNAAVDVVKTFTISKAAQTITFAPTTKQKPAGDFAAGGSSSSGLTVSYSSSTTSVCTVSGSTVSPVGLGTCTIVASQAGDSNYNAATAVTASFTIESVPVQTTAISIASAANYRFGTAITTTAGTWTGTATVAISRAWYRCDTAPSISAGTGSAASLAPADCVLISGAVGTSYTPVAADITKFVAVAETAANTTSTGANSRTTFVSTATAVEKQTQTITFAALANATYGDAPISLTASSDRSLTITYASSNTAVCTVSGSTLTIVSAGSCDVTASQTGDTNTLQATSVTQTLTVNKKAQTINLPAFTSGVYGGAAKASGATATSGLTVTLTSADTAVCTVSGLSVNIVAPGTCSITASQAGNTNYNAAADVTKSFTISKASQTITFAPTTKQKPAGDFAAGGTTSSGLTVTYVSTTTSVCTVSGSTVSPVGLGTCSITASQAGDSNWSAAADVTTSFTIESVPVQTTAEVIASAANYRFGVPVTVTAGTWTGTAAMTVTRAWFRCDTAPSISVGTGTATALKPADCTAISGATNTSYTPVAADITKYLAVAETATNTTTVGTNNRTTFVSTATAVEKQTQTITFGALANATYGDPTISLTASSDRSLTITYTSSNTAVCTVSVSTLTVVAPGNCDVTASQAGDANTLAATSVTRTLTVVKANQTLSLNNLAAIDFRGTPTTLVYSATSGLPVTVASNSTSVCTVSGTTVSVVAVGTCSITASQAGNSNYNAASSVTKTFVISKAQDTLTFTGATKQFRAGNFTISASTLSGASVSFTSTTTSICTVSGTTVTPVTHGACVISATAASNSNYIAPAIVNATFTIERAVEQTTVHSLTSYATYWYDQRIDYTAGTWVGSGTVSVTHTWYICDTRPTTIVVAANTIPTGCTAVAETSTDAYKPVAADIGKYVVLAEMASNVTSGVTNIAKSWISTPGRVTKWTQNLTFGALADKTYGDLPFTLNGISDQGQPVSYVSSNTSVCTVSGSVVSIVAAGSCDITASQAGNTTIAAATPITQTLTVNKASQTITFAALSNITYSNATISIAPTAGSQLPVTTISDDPSVCTLANNVISVLKSGTCSITATQAGNANYTAASAVTRAFQIAKASQTVDFTPPQFLGLQQHDGVDLVATATSGLPVTFTVSNAAICDIQAGKLIPVSTGACVITVAQVGDDRYEASSHIHTVTVADYPVVDAFAPSGDLYTNTSATSFTITFASAITGFAAEDLVTIPAGACTIAEPQLIPASSASYTVELTGCAEGPVSLKLLENTVSNGIPGPAEFSVSTASVGIDFTFANGVTITPGFTSPTNDTTLVYTVTFSEDVTGFDASDLEITGTGSPDCVATVTGSGASYTVSLDGCTDGTVVLKTKAQSVADLATNVGPSSATTATSVTVDRVAPEGPTVTGMPTQYSRSTDLNANFTVDNQLTYRCQLNRVDLLGCDGSLVIPVGSLSSGDYTLEIWAVDAAGNESTRYSHGFSIGTYARPNVPVIGLLDRTSYNHLVVNWAAVIGQSTELPVTALRLEYSINGGSTWTTVDDLAADATSYDLTVQSGQTYSIRLKALSGDYAANASDYSATASYVAVYKPTIIAASTSAALLKPAAGTVITLTGNDLRDFSVINPALNTGTVVTIVDSANKTYTAELVSVTATSIRFKVPAVSKIGVATYKVTVGSANYQRTSANRNLNIVAKKVNQVITFTAPASTTVGNADTQLGATLDSLAAPIYNLAASSTGICTLTSTGVLHPIKGGVCSYTITSPASDAFNAFTSAIYSTTINRMDVAVAFELPADLLAGLDSNNSMPIKPITYALTAIPSDQVQGVSATIWATPETVCFVDADKVLRIIAVGTCTVSAVAENDFYRTHAPVTHSFTIVKNDQRLTFVAPGTTFGMITAPEATDATSGFQLTAFLDSGLSPDFASLNAQVCTVDPAGFVAWVGDLVKNPTQVCDVTIGQAGDSNFNAIETQTIHLTARHVPPQPPVGGYIVEPDGSLAVSRTGGLAASGSDGVAVVVVSGSKISITPFSKGMYIGPITAKVTIPYYVRIKNVATLKTQICTIKWGILKKMKASDPTAFKVKKFPNKIACVANKDVVAYFKEGNRLMPTIVVKRDRKWPTTYLGKEGSNGKGPKIWPRVKTWHLTIG